MPCQVRKKKKKKKEKREEREKRDNLIPPSNSSSFSFSSFVSLSVISLPVRVGKSMTFPSSRKSCYFLEVPHCCREPNLKMNPNKVILTLLLFSLPLSLPLASSLSLPLASSLTSSRFLLFLSLPLSPSPLPSLLSSFLSSETTSLNFFGFLFLASAEVFDESEQE